MSYTAPVKDMLFAIEHLANIEQIAQIPGFEDAGLDTAAAVLEECAKFNEGVLAAQLGRRQEPIEPGKTAWSPPPPVSRRPSASTPRAAGRPAAPADFGGQGLPKTIGAACIEMTNSANMSFALCPLLTDGAIEALLTAGSDELKATYLEKLVTGQWTGTMNLTEPQAGSTWPWCARAPSRSPMAPTKSSAPRSSSPTVSTTWPRTSSTWCWPACTGRAEGVKGISLFVVPKFMVNKDGTLGARNDATA